MSGSVAEERIRAKVEAAMRSRWPSARIIHELVLASSEIRIDLAAVTANEIIVAEIKSERDTLKRLEAQIGMAHEVADVTWVVVAEAYREVLEHLANSSSTGPERPRSPPLTGMWREYWQNPDYLPGLERCQRMVETEDGLALIGQSHRSRVPDPRAVFDMLWAPERRDVIAAAGGPVSSKASCHETLTWAVEHMSGGAIRRAVCATLRRRKFARADPPVTP